MKANRKQSIWLVSVVVNEIAAHFTDFAQFLPFIVVVRVKVVGINKDIVFIV